MIHVGLKRAINRIAPFSCLLSTGFLKGSPMRSSLSLIHRASISSGLRLALVLSAGLAATLTTGCGGSSSSTASANTVVTVLATSTANDQLTQFLVTLQSLTLTSQSGKTVTVFSTPQSLEFKHLNGTVEPLTTATIPQDVYTSATATVEGGFPVCVGLESNGGMLTNGSIGSYTSATGATVNLPGPIKVTGSSMGLVLDLQFSKSISSFSCVSDTLGQAAITPTFSLTPMTIAEQPTNSANGLATGLHGLIGTVAAGGTSFSATSAYGPTGQQISGSITWQVNIGGSTTFQGVTGASQLVPGQPVDMDVAIQQDGTLQATRVAVYDTNASGLTIADGLLDEVVASEPILNVAVDDYQGPLQNGLNVSSPFSFGNAVFQTSGQLANQKALPFTASFNESNMVNGQNVFITTHAAKFSQFPIYVPITTITLLPQTINGTVNAVSSSGGFTTYTVTLAPYDLFPDLAVLPGQTTLLTNPSSVVVYADSNTQQLNTDHIAVGSVLRFNGLIFNDNGRLRMDCAQVNNGVAE